MFGRVPQGALEEKPLFVALAPDLKTAPKCLVELLRLLRRSCCRSQGHDKHSLRSGKLKTSTVRQEMAPPPEVFGRAPLSAQNKP